MEINIDDELNKLKEEKQLAEQNITKYTKLSKRLRILAFCIFPITSSLNLIGAIVGIPLIIYISLCISLTNTLGNYPIIHHLNKKISDSKRKLSQANYKMEILKKQRAKEIKLTPENTQIKYIQPKIELQTEINHTNKTKSHPRRK